LKIALEIHLLYSSPIADPV